MRDLSGDESRMAPDILESVLESMSAAVAVLDRDGVIQWANRAWSRGVAAAAVPAGARRPGVNYLHRLERLAEDGDAVARLACRGIRDVLGQRQPVFELDFPADGPDGQRWFALRATALRANGPPRVVVSQLDITDRKRAETALLDSEERFRSLAELGADWFWEMDAELRFTYVSPVVSQIGIAPDALIGKVLGEVRHSEFDPADLREELAALRARVPFRGIVRPSCTSPGRWVSVSGNPLFDLDGAFCGYHGLTADITERRRSEVALEESQGLLKSIIDNIPVGVLVKDAAHIVELANRTYLQWYGPDAGKMIGHRSDEIEDFQSRREASVMNDQEREVLTTGKTRTRQVERPFADSRIHTVSITKFPIYDLHGRIIKVGSSSVDLTEQVQARRALAESEARFRDFAESSSDWLWETDAEYRFTHLSERNREITGLPPEAFLGKTRRELTIEDSDSEKWRRHGSDLERRRPIRDFRYDLRRPDGTIVAISISGRAMFDEGGLFLGYRGTGTDITDQRRAEAARIGALEEAERANRAKSEFLATMSHELRTPLNAIIGFSDVLSNQYFGPPGAGKYREYAGDIHQSATHLLDLVNDLLDISAIEAGRIEIDKESLSIGDVIDDCVHSVIESIRARSIGLDLAVPDGLPAICADRRAMKQILLNLLSNAVKFTPAGGTISVAARVTGRTAKIDVTDTGEGIDPELLTRLSNPFTRAGRDPFKTEKGWGLGLAIARSLVELHDGELKIVSEYGQGTTVTVSLPVDAR